MVANITSGSKSIKVGLRPDYFYVYGTFVLYATNTAEWIILLNRENMHALCTRNVSAVQLPSDFRRDRGLAAVLTVAPNVAHSSINMRHIIN